MLKHLKYIVALCLLALLSACSDGGQYTLQRDAGTAHMGKVHQTQYLLNAKNSTAQIVYEAAAPDADTTPVDVLILFDRTASMKEVISNTARAASSIVQEVHGNMPNTRFAVAAVADYSPMFTDDADKRTWLLLSDFAYDAKTVANAASAIQLVNGGDRPEAYVRGLYEASELAWRAESKKIIIFFGDAEYHDPDPGRDETMGNADDLNMAQVLAKLKEKGITVVGVYADNAAEIVTRFNEITAQTGGKAVSLSNADESSRIIKSTIQEAFAPPYLLQATGENANLVSNIEVTQTSTTKIRYTVSIALPEADASAYDINLKLLENSTKPQQNLSDKVFTVRIITGWINHWLTLWLPLILLLVYLIYSALSMMRGGYAQKRFVGGKTSGFNTGWLTNALLDILFYASLICTATAIYLCYTNQVLSQIL